MMWLDTAPTVPPVKALRVLSAAGALAVLAPQIHHSSPGAACQRTIPPKAFRFSSSLASVTVEALCGPVAADVYAVEALDRAELSGFMNPSLLGAAKAVGVVPNVDDLASCMSVGELVPARPEMNTSCTCNRVAFAAFNA